MNIKAPPSQACHHQHFPHKKFEVSRFAVPKFGPIRSTRSLDQFKHITQLKSPATKARP